MSFFMYLVLLLPTLGASLAAPPPPGRVFSTSIAPPSFARCVAMPIVLAPSPNHKKWRMWYYGRPDDVWAGGRPAFLPTGRCGCAESNDGRSWEAVAGPLEGGAVLMPEDDEGAWDHVQVGSVDVWEAEDGGYEMLYLGANAEAVDLGMMGAGPVDGFRMRGGLARGGAAGTEWKRGEGPVLDVGVEGEWDSLFASWPRAVPTTEEKEGPWLMTYHR